MMKLDPIQYRLKQQPGIFFHRWFSWSKLIVSDLKEGVSFFVDPVAAQAAIS